MKDLFGYEVFEPREAYQLTRTSDPATSRDAAKRILPKLSKLQTAVFQVIVAAGSRGITLWEIEEHFGNHGSTYRTRVSELCGKGDGMAVRPPLVMDSGRVRNIKGRDRTVWVACLEGCQL